MAQEPYQGGVPEVAPDVKTPDAYQHIQATPESFGAALARGTEKLGEGLEKTSTNVFNIAAFQGKVNSDDQVNKFIEGRNKVMYGDPDKPVIGADGKPAPDTGYTGLEGRAAADQRAAVLKQLNDLREAGRKNLNSPQEQLEYDSATRRMYAEAEAHIGQHADQQWKSWATGVNKSGQNLHLEEISRYGASGNDQSRLTAEANLIQMATQEAQIKYPGGTKEDQDAIINSVGIAKQAGLKAYVDGVAATGDFLKAQRVLDKNKEVAGTLYLPLQNELRAKADMQLANKIVDENMKRAPTTATFSPVVNDAISRAATATGLDPNMLKKLVAIESNGDPNAVTGSYRGLAQLKQDEFQKYGGGNIFDPHDNIMAAARKLKVEQDNFAAQYHRPATTADIYLIHNQGAGGYANHMANPDGLAWQNMLTTGEGQNIAAGRQVYKGQTGPAAATRWARDAVWGNIPDRMKERFGTIDNVSSRDFTSMWAARINSGTFNDAAIQAQKNQLFQAIDADPRLANNPAAKQHAFQVATQRYNNQQIIENQTATAKKEASDKAANDVMGRISRGEAVSASEIYGNEAIPWEHRHSLATIAAQASGEVDVGSYGPGWLKLKQSILADYGDPSKVTDIKDILSHGPGMPDENLTKKGVADLLSTMQLVNTRGVDTHGIERTKVAQLKYAHDLLSFDQEMMFPGAPPMRDKKGEQIFNSQFVGKFEAAYNKWVTVDKKDPMEFLTEEKMKELAQGLRSKAQMDADRLAATGETPQTKENANAPIPAAPPGVDEKAWQTVVAKPPKLSNGATATRQQWAAAIKVLAADPKPEVMAAFDKHMTGGLTAKDVLGQLKIEPGEGGVKAAPTAPAAPAPTAPAKAANAEPNLSEIFNLPQRLKQAQEERERKEEPNLAAADKEMKLTPQEKNLYRIHLENLRGPGGVDNPDGSRSTLFNTTVEMGGKTYVLPTVWDGKKHTVEESVKRARAEGLNKFPAYASEKEADERYNRLHDFMEKDTAAYFDRKREAAARAREPAGREPNVPGAAVPARGLF